MKILLTGVTGYIGKRLLPVLVKKGHTVVCCVRDAQRLTLPESIAGRVEIFEAAIKRTLTAIEDNQIISSWKDSLSSGSFNIKLSDFLVVPTHGCFIDRRVRPVADRALYFCFLRPLHQSRIPLRRIRIEQYRAGWNLHWNHLQQAYAFPHADLIWN